MSWSVNHCHVLQLLCALLAPSPLRICICRTPKEELWRYVESQLADIHYYNSMFTGKHHGEEAERVTKPSGVQPGYGWVNFLCRESRVPLRH